MGFYEDLIVFGPMAIGTVILFCFARFIIGNRSLARCFWVSLGTAVMTYVLYLGITWALMFNIIFNTQLTALTSCFPGILPVLLVTWWILYKGYGGNNTKPISGLKAFLLALTYSLVQGVSLVFSVYLLVD